MNADGTLCAGDWIGEYQAQAPAPVDLLPAQRSRYADVDGHERLIRGAWSDPWWLARPGGGWAITRRWRSKAQSTLTWGADHRYRTVPVPAIDERITEPWEATP